MVKTLCALAGGIFVGAVAMEVVRKKYPDAMEKLCAKAREVTSLAKEAFNKGYQNITEPSEAAQASA